MDFHQTFAISAAGMTVERTRVDVAALNLANANTVQSTSGQPYQALRVVSRPGEAAPAGRFFDLVNTGLESPSAAGIASLVPTATVVSAGTAPRSVYEPGHPLADAKGFVAYAGVDVATEMVSLMSSSRAYEANVAVMNTTRSLALKALDIGGGN